MISPAHLRHIRSPESPESSLLPPIRTRQRTAGMHGEVQAASTRSSTHSSGRPAIGSAALTVAHAFRCCDACHRSRRVTASSGRATSRNAARMPSESTRTCTLVSNGSGGADRQPCCRWCRVQSVGEHCGGLALRGCVACGCSARRLHTVPACGNCVLPIATCRDRGCGGAARTAGARRHREQSRGGTGHELELR